MVQRIGFEIVNTSNNTSNIYNFNINPEEMSTSHPSRTSILPTRTATGVQDFGAGPVVYTLSGTTGWGQGTGQQKAQELIAFLTNFQNIFSDNIPDSYNFIYHNYVDGESNNVKFSPDGFTMSRSKENPLLYKYSISFVRVGDASQASAGEKTATVLGNDSSSLTDGTNKNTGEAYVNPYASTQSSSISQNNLGRLLELK